MNKVEQWKAEKHGFDVWADLLRYAEQRAPMKAIDNTDLERMKWHGVFYRKRDARGRYMLRIRLTAGELAVEQAKQIAYIAYEFGHGILDITTRANIQVQGLQIEDVPKAMARLIACGLTCKQTGHDNVRNVVCHPLSGVDPEELIDTRPLCRAIADLFLDSRTYSDLPRKFNIAISGRPQHGVHCWTQDISYLACRPPEAEEVFFQVLVGGMQGENPHLGRHLPVLVAPDQVAGVTRALLDLFRECGSRHRRNCTRFRYLLDRLGVTGVLNHLEEQLDFRLRPCPNVPQPLSRYDELVGWIRQKDPRRWALGLSVPLGRLSWEQLEGLGRVAYKWGDGSLRTTHEQGVILPNILAGFKDAAAVEAAGLGLSPHADTLARNSLACTGKQFCSIAVTEAKGRMLRLLEDLRKRGLTLQDIRIHMSGCPSSCAQHHTAEIGLKGVRIRRLVGTREGFDVYLAGGLGGQVHLGIPYRLGVDADQLPQIIEEIVKQYYRMHGPGQTFSAYWREKLRELEASKVGETEYTPPTWVCEGCGYRHVGQDPPVFCPSCAGLRRLFARLEDCHHQPFENSADGLAPPAAVV